MRQSATGQRGEAGQAAVVVFFEDLGWGPVATGGQDLGTDLFVQVRRKDLADLSGLLGVQVKTGDGYFGKPTHVGGVKGWWFRESDARHESYWSDHHVPHILEYVKKVLTRELIGVTEAALR